MAAEETAAEITVSDRDMVSIPASLGRHLDIETGDKVRWAVDETCATRFPVSGPSVLRE